MTSPSPRAMNSSPTTFDDATENFTDWVRLHATQVAGTLGAVIVLGGGYMLWRSSVNNRAQRAETAFYDAQAPLSQGNVPAAQTQLQQVAQRYDGTAAGTQAQLLLAQTYYEQGKYQEGINVLSKAASGAPKDLQPGVRQLTAVGYEGLSKFGDAAKLYEQLANDAAGEDQRIDLKANAARDYQLAGDKTTALRLWKELAAMLGKPIADEARIRVGELTVAPAR